MWGQLVGGTASKLGGGKFANGAITGTYVVMFNHLQEPQETDKSNGNWPTTEEIESDFAESFEERIIEEYINEPNYIPTDVDDLAQDLLYSGDLQSDEHYFVITPIRVRIQNVQDGNLTNQIYQKQGYIDSSLPTVLNPGTKEITFTRSGNNYTFVIQYQIRLPL